MDCAAWSFLALFVTLFSVLYPLPAPRGLHGPLLAPVCSTMALALMSANPKGVGLSANITAFLLAQPRVLSN